MSLETFGPGERHGGGAKHPQAFDIELEDRGALHEVEHAKPRCVGNT